MPNNQQEIVDADVNAKLYQKERIDRLPTGIPLRQLVLMPGFHGITIDSTDWSYGARLHCDEWPKTRNPKVSALMGKEIISIQRQLVTSIRFRTQLCREPQNLQGELYSIEFRDGSNIVIFFEYGDMLSGSEPKQQYAPTFKEIEERRTAAQKLLRDKRIG